MNTVLSGVQDEIVDRVVSNLGKDNIVLVHTSKLLKNFDGFNIKEYLKIAKSQSGSSSVDYWDTVPYTDISGTTYDGIYPDYDIEDGIVVSGKTAVEN